MTNTYTNLRVTAENAVRTAFATLSDLRDDLTLDTQWADRWTISSAAGLWVNVFVSDVYNDHINRVPVTVGVWDAVAQKNHNIASHEASLGALEDVIENVFAPRSASR